MCQGNEHCVRLTGIRFAVLWYMRGIVVGAKVVKRASAAAYELYRTGLRTGFMAFPQPCEPAGNRDGIRNSNPNSNFTSITHTAFETRFWVMD